MSVQAHVRAGRDRLLNAGLTQFEATADAEVLARSVLGWDRTTYLINARMETPLGFLDQYQEMVTRRAKREPVSLITGHKEFWGLDFTVTRDVLTPRPETEIVVAEALLQLSKLEIDPALVVDVGTGSGCLAIVIARENKSAAVTATDISSAALDIARHNAERLGVGDRIRWLCAPFLTGVDENPHLIVANLPYVREKEIPTLPPEVQAFEPEVALNGGPDGLQAIRILVELAENRLAPGGYLIAEIGAGQSEALLAHLQKTPGLSFVRLHDDLQGIPRVVVIKRTTKL